MSGIIGVVGGSKIPETLFYGTDYLSHMGTAFGGIAIFDDALTTVVKRVDNAQFKSKFHDAYTHLEGKMGIGVISDRDVQPVSFRSHLGPFAVCIAGLIENIDELASKLLEEHFTFSESMDGRFNAVEVVGKIISRAPSFPAGIDELFRSIRGSCSLLVLAPDGIYAALDRHGYNPLAIGKGPDGWAVTTETCAFPNLDFSVEKTLSPGEIAFLTPAGYTDKTISQETQLQQICSFLWIYTGFPTTSYHGTNVEEVRERCGAYLARRDTVEADLVSGVPDSGIGHAVGYAIESRLPYRRVLVKYTPGYGRSYTPLSQDVRDRVAKMKLLANQAIIRDKRIVICEDSIVRGTQLKNFTVQKLWAGGAKEVHIRPACPPLMFPCRFNLSTRRLHELAAQRAIETIEGKEIHELGDYLDHTSKKDEKMVDMIVKSLGVTTLRYQRMDDMIAAIGLPREQLCTYCWNGETPQADVIGAPEDQTFLELK